LSAEPIELHIKCDNRALGRFVRTSEPGSRPGEPRRRDTHQPGWRRLVARATVLGPTTRGRRQL